MIEVGVIFILLAGIVSFLYRMKEFNELPAIQKKALSDFKKINKEMSLSDVNELLGKKGKKVKFTVGPNRYCWYFGDSVIVKTKSGTIVPFADFIKNIDNRYNYSLKLSPAYIEVDFIDGKNLGGIAVGLN